MIMTRIRRAGLRACAAASFLLVLPAEAPAVAATPPAAAKPKSCAVARPSIGGLRAFDFEGQARSYLLALPPGYDGRRAYPLVLSLHGHGGDKERHDANTQVSAKASVRGFIVVTPDSRPPNWNIREEPARAHDFAFIDALLGELTKRLCVDEDRVYAAGHSNGAAFAGLLGCRPPYRFAAVALVSGTPPLSCPAAVAPPTLFIRGTADATVKYEGGVLGGALASTARYAEAYGCAPNVRLEAVIPGVKRLRYSGCRNGGEVVLDTVEGGVHIWPGGPKAAAFADNSLAGRTFKSTDEVLDFFEAHHGRPWTATAAR